MNNNPEEVRLRDLGTFLMEDLKRKFEELGFAEAVDEN